MDALAMSGGYMGVYNFDMERFKDAKRANRRDDAKLCLADADRALAQARLLRTVPNFATVPE